MTPETRQRLANACLSMTKEMILDSMPNWPLGLTIRQIEKRAFGTNTNLFRGSRHYSTKALLEELELEGRAERTTNMRWTIAAQRN